MGAQPDQGLRGRDPQLTVTSRRLDYRFPRGGGTPGATSSAGAARLVGAAPTLSGPSSAPEPESPSVAQIFANLGAATTAAFRWGFPPSAMQAAQQSGSTRPTASAAPDATARSQAAGPQPGQGSGQGARFADLTRRQQVRVQPPTAQQRAQSEYGDLESDGTDSLQQLAETTQMMMVDLEDRLAYTVGDIRATVEQLAQETNVTRSTMEATQARIVQEMVLQRENATYAIDHNRTLIEDASATIADAAAKTAALQAHHADMSATVAKIEATLTSMERIPTQQADLAAEFKQVAGEFKQVAGAVATLEQLIRAAPAHPPQSVQSVPTTGDHTGVTPTASDLSMADRLRRLRYSRHTGEPDATSDPGGQAGAVSEQQPRAGLSTPQTPPRPVTPRAGTLPRHPRAVQEQQEMAAALDQLRADQAELTRRVGRQENSRDRPAAQWREDHEDRPNDHYQDVAQARIAAQSVEDTDPSSRDRQYEAVAIRKTAPRFTGEDPLQRSLIARLVLRWWAEHLRGFRVRGHRSIITNDEEFVSVAVPIIFSPPLSSSTHAAGGEGETPQRTPAQNWWFDELVLVAQEDDELETSDGGPGYKCISRASAVEIMLGMAGPLSPLLRDQIWREVAVINPVKLVFTYIQLSFGGPSADVFDFVKDYAATPAGQNPISLISETAQVYRFLYDDPLTAEYKDALTRFIPGDTITTHRDGDQPLKSFVIRALLEFTSAGVQQALTDVVDDPSGTIGIPGITAYDVTFRYAEARAKAAWQDEKVESDMHRKLVRDTTHLQSMSARQQKRKQYADYLRAAASGAQATPGASAANGRSAGGAGRGAGGAPPSPSAWTRRQADRAHTADEVPAPTKQTKPGLGALPEAALSKGECPVCFQPEPQHSPAACPVAGAFPGDGPNKDKAIRLPKDMWALQPLADFNSAQRRAGKQPILSVAEWNAHIEATQPMNQWNRPVPQVDIDVARFVAHRVGNVDRLIRNVKDRMARAQPAAHTAGDAAPATPLDGNDDLRLPENLDVDPAPPAPAAHALQGVDEAGYVDLAGDYSFGDLGMTAIEVSPPPPAEAHARQMVGGQALPRPFALRIPGATLEARTARPAQSRGTGHGAQLSQGASDLASDIVTALANEQVSIPLALLLQSAAARRAVATALEAASPTRTPSGAQCSPSSGAAQHTQPHVAQPPTGTVSVAAFATGLAASYSADCMASVDAALAEWATKAIPMEIKHRIAFVADLAIAFIRPGRDHMVMTFKMLFDPGANVAVLGGGITGPLGFTDEELQRNAVLAGRGSIAGVGQVNHGYGFIPAGEVAAVLAPDDPQRRVTIAPEWLTEDKVSSASYDGICPWYCLQAIGAAMSWGAADSTFSYLAESGTLCTHSMLPSGSPVGGPPAEANYTRVPPRQIYADPPPTALAADDGAGAGARTHDRVCVAQARVGDRQPPVYGANQSEAGPWLTVGTPRQARRRGAAA